MNQFEAKVKYYKEENGEFNKVTEVFLFANAKSFSETETLIKAVIFGENSGETSIESISRRKYQYTIHDGSNNSWYKCQTKLVQVDPDTEKETVVKNTYLVQAESLEGAGARLKDFIGDDIFGELDIFGIVRTPILDVVEDSIEELGEVLGKEIPEDKEGKPVDA